MNIPCVGVTSSLPLCDMSKSQVTYSLKSIRNFAYKEKATLVIVLNVCKTRLFMA